MDEISGCVSEVLQNQGTKSILHPSGPYSLPGKRGFIDLYII